MLFHLPSLQGIKKPAGVIGAAGQETRTPENFQKFGLLLHNSLHCLNSIINEGLPITVELYYKQGPGGRAILVGK
jgi:hypothetical protein